MDSLNLPRSRPRRYALLGLSAFFIAAGSNHFLNPGFYLAIMPPYLPGAGMLVALSGALEVAGGVAVLVPKLRARAGWGLTLLLVALLPANVHMAMNAHLFPEIPAGALYGRLPLQGLLVWWALWATRSASVPGLPSVTGEPQ